MENISLKLKKNEFLMRIENNHSIRDSNQHDALYAQVMYFMSKCNFNKL